jgi:hypothetical protein
VVVLTILLQIIWDYNEFLELVAKHALFLESFFFEPRGAGTIV